MGPLELQPQQAEYHHVVLLHHGHCWTKDPDSDPDPEDEDDDDDDDFLDGGTSDLDCVLCLLLI